MYTDEKQEKYKPKKHTPFPTHAEMRNMDAWSAGVKRSAREKKIKKPL